MPGPKRPAAKSRVMKHPVIDEIESSGFTTLPTGARVPIHANIGPESNFKRAGFEGGYLFHDEPSQVALPGLAAAGTRIRDCTPYDFALYSSQTLRKRLKRIAQKILCPL